MTIPGYVPAIGEKDSDKIARGVRNLYENIPAAITAVETSIGLDITAIEGDVDAIELDIIAIEGDVSAIEGDVSTLQTEVLALQAHTALHFKTGTYTGDGTTSKAVTGLGFQPKFLLITLEGADGATGATFLTSNTLITTDAQGLAYAVGSNTLLDNRILSLNADGFTVSDDSTDANPNANTSVYHYVAWA